MAKRAEKVVWADANAKWTHSTGQHGYSALPNILFWYAGRLGIKPAQQAVLFQLVSRWWKADEPPVVSKAMMAKGLGITERQVQRHIQALKIAGLIEAHFPKRPGRHPNQFTFNGLVNELGKIAVAHRSEKRQKQFSRDRAVRSISKERDP